MLSIGHRTVLLDFDGVVFKNKRATDIITDKSIKFIQSKTKYNYEQAEKINKVIYPTKGHTSFAINNKKETLIDYNEYVFENFDYNQLNDIVTKYDKELIQNLVNIKKYRGIEFILFTNAPIMWCLHVMHSMDFKLDDLFLLDKIFTSDNGLIKPMNECYDNIEKNIKERKLHFIDDKMSNILPISSNNNWCGFMIDDTDHLYEHLSEFS
jgi:hypothetical protein